MSSSRGTWTIRSPKAFGGSDLDGLLAEGRWGEDRLSCRFNVILHMQRRNRTVYSMITEPGYMGAITGQKAGVVAVDINERSSSPLGLALFVSFGVGRFCWSIRSHAT